jgi:hypothetical protein
MSEETIGTRREAFRRVFERGKIENRPEIKILLYTDAPELVTKEVTGMFSLGRMIDHLKGHPPAFAALAEPRVESRYRNNSRSANNKLDTLLSEEKARTGSTFDQIWFFGIHQINKTIPNLGLGGGTPESELTAEEVRALRQWMEEDQGGVLITGDHANPRPPDAIPTDPNPLNPDPARDAPFLGLGRALGRTIPRAGEMRSWEGDPTSYRGHRFNTQVAVPGGSPSAPGLEGDPTPQRIQPTLFDEIGRPAQIGQPHPLFFYRDEVPIQVLPDHAHEGGIVVPDLSNEDIWKRNSVGFQPVPHIAAQGFDAERRIPVNLISTYDGTSVNVGRIVADSSWHHYFNLNLESLLFPAAPDSPADQIGQFYGNLAIWLSPPKKRQEMAQLMIDWLAKQPMVLEENGPGEITDPAALLATGGAVLKPLKRIASPCEIHELLQMTLVAESNSSVKKTSNIKQMS